MTTRKWNNEEEFCFNLQKLYSGFGYQRYKMSKFEEYSFYLDNKNFLQSQSVITFNDHGGKLMALKPDVTLSIVKSAADGQPRKVYYRESVYRPDKATGEFREISQIGLEVLGGVDDVTTAEVLFLAAKSLEEIGSDYILDIAHPGVVAGLVEDYGAASFASELYTFISAKNTHDLKNFCQEKGISSELADKIAALISCGGDYALALETALKAAGETKSLSALRSICKAAESLGIASRVRPDFSIVGDADYYKGVMFMGYVGDLPCPVLSGGRYDKLAGKYGIDSGIGFALYLDQLSFYGAAKSNKTSAIVLYDDATTPAKVVAAVKKFADSGLTAAAMRSLPKGFGGQIKDLRR